LEKLNAFAEACSINDSQGVFALTDEALSSGVAIEQFIIDLAGYYRSLLLLKNGVTRESLLGYRPAAFSSKALETYDSIRLEQALDILLDCYRNIRYSVSPRFELETAVSKLSWLNRWVSPVELKEAVDDARNVLGQSGVHNASSGKTSTPQKSNVGSFAPSNAVFDSKAQGIAASSTAEERSLSDELRKISASKETASPVSVSASGKPSAQGDEDEDVPLWDNIRRKNDENKQPPQVERILSLIPGMVID
jgi:DNA polymerase-3 subunit gamma/tau